MAGRRLYVFDTSVVLSLLGQNDTDRARRDRLNALLAARREDIFAVTAPGLAESFGCPMPAGIQVLDMTAAAGLIAGRLRQVWFEGLPRDIRKHVNPHMVKVDHLILATAEAWTATALYTEDRHFATLAERAKLTVEVRRLPPVPIQGDLGL